MTTRGNRFFSCWLFRSPWNCGAATESATIGVIPKSNSESGFITNDSYISKIVFPSLYSVFLHVLSLQYEMYKL